MKGLNNNDFYFNIVVEYYGVYEKYLFEMIK